MNLLCDVLILLPVFCWDGIQTLVRKALLPLYTLQLQFIKQRLHAWMLPLSTAVSYNSPHWWDDDAMASSTWWQSRCWGIGSALWYAPSIELTDYFSQLHRPWHKKEDPLLTSSRCSYNLLQLSWVNTAFTSWLHWWIPGQSWLGQRQHPSVDVMIPKRQEDKGTYVAWWHCGLEKYTTMIVCVKYWPIFNDAVRPQTSIGPTCIFCVPFIASNGLGLGLVGVVGYLVYLQLA